MTNPESTFIGDAERITLTPEDLAYALARSQPRADLVGGVWLEDPNADEWLEWAHEILGWVKPR